MPGFEEDRDYFNGQSGSKVKKLTKDRDVDTSGVLSFAKVFLYMFMYLAITAAVAFGLGALITHLYASSIAAGGTGEEVLRPFLGVMIGSAVALIIMMLVVNFVVLRGKHSVLVPSIIYSILVGVLFSTFTIFIDWRIMGMAFGITSGIFLLMGLIALVSKGNFAPLGMLGFGLILGGGLLALANWLIGSTTIWWIVSFVIFAAVMFIAMFDVWNVKKITERGAADRNISFYYAFVMYTDFINVFIRILYFLLIIFGNKK